MKTSAHANSWSHVPWSKAQSWEWALLNHNGTFSKARKDQAEIFSLPKKHQQKKVETHTTLLDNNAPLVCFLEQSQNADCTNNVIDWLKKDRKGKKWKVSSKLSVVNTIVYINVNIITSRNTAMNRCAHCDHDWFPCHTFTQCVSCKNLWHSQIFRCFLLASSSRLI